VALFGNQDPRAISALLAEIDPDLPVAPLDADDLAGVPDKEAYLVLASAEAQRQTLLAAGFPPGQVWTEHDLLSQFNA
jgi:hypothetical protein